MYNIDLREMTLNGMIGVDLKKLKKQAKNLKFDAAILLTGPPGCGKTSTALIIAKTINCKNKQLNEFGYYDPCNKCVNCLDVDRTHFRRDIVMINGRDLLKGKIDKLEQSINRTSFDRDAKKIYIVDECHEISKGNKSMFLTITELQHNSHLIFTTSERAEFIKDNAFYRRFQETKFPSIQNFDIIAKYLINKIDFLKLNLPDTFYQDVLNLLIMDADGSPGLALKFLQEAVENEVYTAEQYEQQHSAESINEYDFLFALLNKDKKITANINLYNLEDLIKRSYMYLLDIQNWKNSNKLKFKWVIRYYKRFKDYDLVKLIKLYNEISIVNKPYFDKQLTFGKILEFLA
jgi:DNA polymerase-3 subunit gamma/tau